MNYQTAINRIIDYKKLADILGILLIMTLLYSFARQHAIHYQTMNALTKEMYQSRYIQENSGWTARIGTFDELNPKAVNRTEQRFLYIKLPLLNPPLADIEQEPEGIIPESPAITKTSVFIAEPAIDSSNPTIVSPELPITTTGPVIISPDSTMTTEESTTDSPKPPITSIEPVIISPAPTTTTEESTTDSPKPSVNTIKPEVVSPQPPAITENPEIVTPKPPSTTIEPDVVFPNPPTIIDNPTTGTPEPPSVIEDSNNNSDISDTDIDKIPPKEEVDDTTFLCKGFLCDSSGIIIGCQDIVVIDGVLRIPSAETCTGIAADALASLGTQVYEIYIPANITVIQEGAFNGLTELYYIEIHPDNPVYTSKEGLLYEK